MFKPTVKNWLHEVEVMEERLEVLKLAAWENPSDSRHPTSSIILETAGLLKKKVASGVAFQKRIRSLWGKSFHRKNVVKLTV